VIRKFYALKRSLVPGKVATTGTEDGHK